MVGEETIVLGSAEIERAHVEREEAARQAQAAALEGAEEEGAAAAPDLPAAQPVFTLETTAVQVDMLCGLAIAFGGREIDPLKRATIVQLIHPAMVKYEGQLPYAEEIMAVAGASMFWAAAFGGQEEAKAA